MNKRILPALGAFLSLFIIYLVGVIFFYGPIAAEAAPGTALVPAFVALLISTILFVSLFVWIAREMGNPLKAALAVALSQLLLVDVDYVLTGRRGLAEAAASAVLLLVAWAITGWVYGKLDGSRGVSPGRHNGAPGSW